ncbi:MAG: DUF2812 domain-containing protein [Clostridium sp.]|nr:DUF2812 domain-containing protein [Clostridium sp.]
MLKRFWVPYEAFDVESIRVWLEEKAEEGFRLKKMKPYFAVFEETDRLSLKFHIEPTIKDIKKPESGIIESRLERGWTYAGTISGHFHVFYAEQKATDFYEDKKTVKYLYEEKLKKDAWFVFGSIITLLLFFFQNMIGSRQPVLWIIENFDFFQAATTGFILFGIISTIITYIKHNNIIKRFENEDEFYPTSKLYRVLKLFGYGAIIIFMILTAIQLFSSEQNKEDLVNSLDEKPIVSLYELESSGNNGIVEEEFSYYRIRSESLFLDEMITNYQNEYLDTKRTYSSDLTTTFYLGKSENIIGILEQQLIDENKNKTSISDYDSEIISGVTVSILDGVTQEIMILSLKERLLKVSYSGGGKLKNWKEIIVKSFLEYSISQK